MMTRRSNRVGDAIKETIAELLLREVKDPRIGMVSVTGVDLSVDLRHARVFFSVFGGETQRSQTEQGLRSATGFIRAEVARRLKLRVAPRIVFEFDPSLQQAGRVSSLLSEVLPNDEDKET